MMMMMMMICAVLVPHIYSLEDDTQLAGDQSDCQTYGRHEIKFRFLSLLSLLCVICHLMILC